MARKAGIPDENDLPEEDCENMAGARAWFSHTNIDSSGNESSGKDPASVALFAVCVHRDLPINLRTRLDLLRDVLEEAGARVGIRPIVVVLPGGYFGFDANAWWNDRNAWHHTMSPSDDDVVRREVGAMICDLAPGSVIIFGTESDKQRAWIVQALAGTPVVTEIVRAETELKHRQVQIGALRIAVFVCGEFTGSSSAESGPYAEGSYLEEPQVALSGVGLLVDLAHAYVRGTVNAPSAGKRHVHQRQMEKFASAGASVLVHSHGGETTQGRARHDAASDWIIFRGGQWIGESHVQALP